MLVKQTAESGPLSMGSAHQGYSTRTGSQNSVPSLNSDAGRRFSRRLRTSSESCLFFDSKAGGRENSPPGLWEATGEFPQADCLKQYWEEKNDVRSEE